MIPSHKRKKWELQPICHKNNNYVEGSGDG